MQTQHKLVLVIEDEAPLRSSLIEALQAQGYQILGAAGGESGLTLALSRHPDLILLDLMMPNVNGFQVLDRLREDPWGRDANVIVLTNDASVSSINKVLEKAVKIYFIKVDTTLKNITTAVHDALGQPT